MKTGSTKYEFVVENLVEKIFIAFLISYPKTLRLRFRQDTP